MLIKEKMTPQADVISPDTTISQAAKEMRDKDFGFLPVGENDRLIGTITDRDIAMRAVAEGKDPDATTVRDCMSSDVIWCYDETEISEGAELMRARQIRRMPVVNRDKRLVGVVSLGDLATDSATVRPAARALSGISEETPAARH